MDKYSPKKGSEPSPPDGPSEKWFNTKINGVECQEIRAFMETLSPQTFKLVMPANEQEKLVSKVLEHLTKTRGAKWGYYSSERKHML